MKFKSDEQRKAVMAKLSPSRKSMSLRLRARAPYHTKGKTIPIENPQVWLAQAAALLRDAEDSEKRRHSPEGVFRQAYPSAEIAIKAARGEHETGKKGHLLARPLGKLAEGRFCEEYAKLPGIAGRTDDIAAQITPEVIGLAKVVEAFWPPYMDGGHGPINEEAKDKTLRLAKELDRILQPAATKAKAKAGSFEEGK